MTILECIKSNQSDQIIFFRIVTGQKMDFYSKGSNINSYSIENLEPYTEYHLSLSADNNFGYGPPATTRFRTSESGKGSEFHKF